MNDLIDSKTVLISYNSANPDISLSQTKNLSSYKLYFSDVGLFTTMLFNDRSKASETIYQKLLSNKIDVNLGYLYENAVAQIIKSTDRELFYHTWKKDVGTHYYKIDFLFVKNQKVVPVEVKSGKILNYNSLTEFCKKYSAITGSRYVIAQKDYETDGMIEIKPFYLTPFIVETESN